MMGSADSFPYIFLLSDSVVDKSLLSDILEYKIANTVSQRLVFCRQFILAPFQFVDLLC